jgi:hypothetical protein
MPLNILIEPIVEGLVNVVTEIISEIVGDGIADAFQYLLSRKQHKSSSLLNYYLGRSYSKAYCDSFFCMKCPGLANSKRAKMSWYLYKCQDCQSQWRVMIEKPWIRRERKGTV